MNNWISVKDRLPDKELDEYIKFCADNNAFFRADDDGFPGIEVVVMIVGATLPTVLFYDGVCFHENDTIYSVTHWMPLPEPPKGD